MPLGAAFYYVRNFLSIINRTLKENFYSQQIIRYRCRVGKHLLLENTPFFMGDGAIEIGDNVKKQHLMA
jgi:hypothetical protein